MESSHKLRTLLGRSARLVIEAPHMGWVRKLVMVYEARREEEFVLQQAGKATFAVNVGLQRLAHLGPTSEVDTFFILGSSGSVEDLTRENFAEIRAQRSVGINSWVVHDFIPDIFCLESVPQVGDGDDFGRFLRILQRSEIRAAVPEILVLRPALDSEIQKVSLIPRELSVSISFYGRVSPATRKDHCLVEDIGSFFESVSPTNASTLLDSGASVVRMVILGIRLGFKKIVLVGVDLDGSPYFWERNPRYLENLQMNRPSNNQKKGDHETLNPRNRPFPVDTMLKKIHQYLFSNRKGALFVASETSLLAEEIPVFKWGAGGSEGDKTT